MKKQLVILAIVAPLVCVGLSGCYEEKVTKADADKFLGTWTCYNWWKPLYSDPGTSQNYTMIFYSNMSVKDIYYGLYKDGSTSESWDTWGVKDNIFQFGRESDEIEPTYYSYIFTNDYKNLEMTEVYVSGAKVIKIYLSK